MSETKSLVPSEALSLSERLKIIREGTDLEKLGKIFGDIGNMKATVQYLERMNNKLAEQIQAGTITQETLKRIGIQKYINFALDKLEVFIKQAHEGTIIEHKEIEAWKKRVGEIWVNFSGSFL